METKKRNSVFFQADLSHGWFVREKTKNENLIVVAGCGENHFSFFEFPDYLFNMEFDPEYAERVTNCSNGAFSLVGWPESDGDFHPIYFRAYLATLQNFVFVQDVRLPIGDAAFAYDGLLPLPDGSVFQISPWGDWDLMQEAISSAVKRRDAAKNGGGENWFAKMKTESKAEVEKKFGVHFGGEAVVSTLPDGPPPAAASGVLPPGFVAVPLPDDGKPALDYCRKPGHYMTFNGDFVDLTYNVGTGVDQIEGKLEFPWVHFDPLRRGLAWHVFYTPHGKAYSWNGQADGRNQFAYLPAYDIVKKCVSVASDSPQDVQAAWEATAVPVEHFNQTAEQFSKFRGEVGEAFSLLAKAFGVCDCRCGGEGSGSDVAASHAREDLESKLTESRAEVHSLNKRIAELACALFSEKQVSAELDAKCDRLTEQWVGIVEIVEKLTGERDAACRERDGLAAKFGTAMAQRDLAREELSKLQAEREPRDNGNGTETKLIPVTHPKGLDVIEVRTFRTGDTFHGVFGGAVLADSDDTNKNNVWLILRPVPKPPEPVTWEAPLADGEWSANQYGAESDRHLLGWDHWGTVLHGLTKPAILGMYQFKDGVGTLIKAADGSGKAGS